MSLRLDDHSENLNTCEPIEVSTSFDGKYIFIDDLQISMSDFMHLTKYVFTNTDLIEDDPRISTLEQLKSLRVGSGYNPGGFRFK